MTWKSLLAGAAALGLGAAAWGLFSASTEAGGQPKTSDIVAGAALYQQNCAECHGAALEGQPDWQRPGSDGVLPAPPHDETGHTWHHGDQMLFTYTQLGGAEIMARQGLEFDSGMPGFGDSLSDAEIWNILAFIKSTWPDRVREVQAVRTEAERRQTGN
jgi:mono/diheme cytochrome c family protein